MGRFGALRIWGAAVRFLSASIVAVGGNAQQNLPVDHSFMRLHLGRVGGGRFVDVRAGSAMARSARCHVFRRAVRGESLPSRYCLLAQRLRGVAGILPGAFVVAVCFAGGRWEASCDPLGGRTRRSMADECPRSGDDSLLAGAAGSVLRVETSIAATPAGGRRCDCDRSVRGGFLSAASGLRTALGEYRRGRIAGIASAGQFSLRAYDGCRS